MLSHRLMQSAGKGTPRVQFLDQALHLLLEAFACDEIELDVKERGRCYRSVARRRKKHSFSLEFRELVENDDCVFRGVSDQSPDLEYLLGELFRGRCDSSSGGCMMGTSFWTTDTSSPVSLWSTIGGKRKTRQLIIGGAYRSLLVIPIMGEDGNMGLLQLKSLAEGFFSADDVAAYGSLAQTLGVALMHRHAQIELRERVKELTCLYGIAKVVQEPGISLKGILQKVVELLPPGWLYPEIASARIVVDRSSYKTANFRKGEDCQTADIVVSGARRGAVEVHYSMKKPQIDEGPFLREERSLIDTIARELGLIIEQKTAEGEKKRLEEQLRHADRLATIGQLSAGVAHEINEPLGNILGFAQLADKTPDLPGSAQRDIEKIVSASLHAREVIKKLMIFARQMPPEQGQIDLNDVVQEGLDFMESRCAKEGIRIVRELSPNLPEITADPAQLQQVLINLVVNAIHAMPKGGTLTVRSTTSDDYVMLAVEDTGVGMTDKIQKQIFLPFFTTKDVGQGTGLGLSVVHGIVTAHRGTIRVNSAVGRGSRFEVLLPTDEAASQEDVK
jgi:signal transduction histidine kinase